MFDFSFCSNVTAWHFTCDPQSLQRTLPNGLFLLPFFILFKTKESVPPCCMPYIGKTLNDIQNNNRFLTPQRHQDFFSLSNVNKSLSKILFPSLLFHHLDSLLSQQQNSWPPTSSSSSSSSSLLTEPNHTNWPFTSQPASAALQGWYPIKHTSERAVYEVIEGQNVHDQIAFCTFHSFLVEAQTKVATYVL